LRVSVSCTAFDIVMSYDFTSQLCALTRNGVICFHSALLKRNYSVCRKAFMTPETITHKERAGFLVRSDARNFPDALEGTGLECKLNIFQYYATDDELCW